MQDDTIFTRLNASYEVIMWVEWPMDVFTV